jgi:hypothetical protein
VDEDAPLAPSAGYRRLRLPKQLVGQPPPFLAAVALLAGLTMAVSALALRTAVAADVI